MSWPDLLDWLDANLVSILNGVAIGFLLFILAIGLSLIFGMMDVLNLAHGALFLLGAYLAWAVAGSDPSWGGFLLAIVVAALAGLVSGGTLATMVEPLRRRGHLDQALLTLGVALVVSELLAVFFGRDVRTVNPPPGLDGTVLLFGAAYPVYRLALIGAGAVLAIVVYLVVERTTVGALVRATVADRDMVSAIGVAQHRIRLAVLGLGSLMAAVAGVLGTPIFGARPGLDATVLILALVVVVIGGLGSVRGALAAALIIGQIESLGRALWADAASFILFGALAIVLIVRPQGLFARPGVR